MADENEFVWVRLAEHDSSVAPGYVTRKAFDEIWSKRGHVIVDDNEASLLSSPETQAELANEETTKTKSAAKKG